jgi:hypothetical protein
VLEGMTEDEASEALDELMENYGGPKDPIFIQPFEFFDSEDENVDILVVEEAA